jgi:hypothetical protein
MSHNTAEAHFRLMLLLMMVFFCAEIVLDGLWRFGYTASKIGNGMTRDIFMALFGVAIGIFRGLKPDGEGGDSAENRTVFQTGGETPKIERDGSRPLGLGDLAGR